MKSNNRFLIIFSILLICMIGLVGCGSGGGGGGGGGGETNNTPATNIPATVSNTKPVAVIANGEFMVDVGATVELDGAGSYDDNEDPLTYLWSVTEKPAGSNASITGKENATCTFTPDLAGTYKIQLVVNDGTVESDPALATLTSMVKVPVNVDVPQSKTSSDLSLLSAYNEEKPLNSSGSAELVTAGDPQIVAVLDDTDSMIYLGTLKGSSPITLNARTTAESLITLHPLIAATAIYDKDLVINTLSTLPEVDALAALIQDKIDNDSNGWEDMEDPEINQALEDGINAFFTALAKDEAAQKSISNKIDMQQPEENLSGLLLSVVGNTKASTDPKIKLNIDNQYNRWVLLDLGDLSEDILLPPGKEYPSITIDPNDPVNISDDTMLVKAYGPGLSGSSLPDGAWPKVIKPSAYTLIEQVVLPFVTITFGKGNCFANIISPVTGDRAYLNDLLKNNNFDSAVRNDRYVTAGVMAGLQAMHTIIDGTMDCGITKLAETAVKKIGRKFIPVLGQIETVIMSAKLAVKLGPVVHDFARSSAYEKWEITNDVNAELVITGIDATDRLYTYENCPEGAVCRKIAWEQGKPFTVNFELQCENIEGFDDCNNAAWFFGDSESDPGGSTQINHIYNDPGVYSGSVIVSDFDDGTVELYFELEVAVPEISLQGVTEGDGIEYEDTPVDQEKTRTFTIGNTGESDLMISSITSTNTAFSIEGATAATIGPDMEHDFSIVFSPDDEDTFTATIEIVSNDPENEIFDFIVVGDGVGKFTDNEDGTVTDNDTDLMWQQDDDNTWYTWQGAISYCLGLSFAGHSDWRLPSLNELLSIEDNSRFDPAIDTSYFPSTKSSYYWSSTTHINNSDVAWFNDFLTDMKYGDLDNYYFPTSWSSYDDGIILRGIYARCVRSVQ